jgi:glyoxylase-like metal-dependent hydrolase (beta-lactamase superfamily II)
VLTKVAETAGTYKVSDRIYSIGWERGGHVRAFLLDTPDDGLILIDALFEVDGRYIVEAISGIGRKPADLKHIVVTHAHRSHLGGVAALKKLSGAKLWAHEWEADIIAGERSAQGVSLIPRRPLRAYHLQFGLALGLKPHEPCEVDAFLREGDSIGPVQAIGTPGHSPGHLAFYWPQEHALFAGDTLVTWPYFGLGWPGLNLNHDQHRRTLGKIRDLDVTIIAVGHGDPAIGQQTEILRRLIRKG